MLTNVRDGIMMNPDVATLWAIFGHIGSKWQNADYCDMSLEQFSHAITQQVELKPVYLGHYNFTTAHFKTLCEEEGGNQELAMDRLFTENRLPSPRYPQIAQFVLVEFMRWQVAFGGFRAFDYQNYSGWIGGGSFLKMPPPYRAIK